MSISGIDTLKRFASAVSTGDHSVSNIKVLSADPLTYVVLCIDLNLISDAFTRKTKPVSFCIFPQG